MLITINKKTLLKREGFHSEYAHANDFDYASQCAIGTDFARSHSKENTPDQCCGDYPTRFPFMSKDGIHKCCGSKIFNPEYTVKFLKASEVQTLNGNEMRHFKSPDIIFSLVENF